MRFLTSSFPLFIGLKAWFKSDFYIVGVGADDTFILVKSWSMAKPDPNLNRSEQMGHLLATTLSHAFLSMLVTSLSTATAFMASFISSITAIKCFRWAL